jgi:aspartate 1-decarboxylase
MTLEMLKSKIHRATVTLSALDYIGSITVDEALMEAAGLTEYEKVEIADVDNGARFSTYVICGEANSGIICLNGAAARMVSTGDKVIIMSYAQMTPEEIKENPPKVVFVNDDNTISRITRYEKHGKLSDLK